MISSVNRMDLGKVRTNVVSPLSVVLLLCFSEAAMMAAPPRPFGRNTGTDKHRAGQSESPQKDAESHCGRWVAEEVPFIITTEEKAWAANVRTDKDCAQFIKDFWERRNPNPGSPENKFKEQYYKRVAYAKQHFHRLGAGPRDDRARIYILYGPPDKIELATLNPGKPATGESDASAVKERWIYNFIDGIGEHVGVEFTDPSKSGEWRVVTDPETLRKPTA